VPADTPEWRIASRAFGLALAEPEQAVTLATSAITAARRHRDPAELALARHALGLALRYLQRMPESVAALRQAVRTATAAGLLVEAALARRSLAVSLTYIGRHRLALAALDQAAAVLSGVELQELIVQRGTVLYLLGRPAEVAATVPSALPALTAAGSLVWVARGRNALGLAEVELGRFADAEDSFRQAEELFEQLGQHADAAGNRHDRGWVASLLGDIPTALRHYEQAERRFAALHLPLVELQLDQARLLLAAGLGAQAVAVARRAADELAGRGAQLLYADALLMLGEATLLAGDAAAATRAAQRARALFRRHGQPGREAQARRLAVRSRFAAGERGGRLQREALLAAAGLDQDRRSPVAADAMLIAGRLALERGDRAGAARALRAAAAGRRHGPAQARSQAWLAAALLRLDGGDRRGALAALLAGLRLLEAHRAGLGAIELRASVAGAAGELVELGRRLAVESGRPRQALRWFEHGRATALRLPPVRPPADPQLAAALAELRLLTGQPDSRRQRELRDLVRRRTHRLVGAAGPVSRLAPTVDQIRPVLGDRALVSICAVDGWLHAVVVTAGSVRLRPLAALADVSYEAGFLLMALRRVLLSGAAGPAALRSGAVAGTVPAPGSGIKAGIRPGSGADGGRAGGWEPDGAADRDARAAAGLVALTAAGARVDRLLLAPLRPLLGDRDVVLVPPAALSTLPWHALPTVAGRPVVVAPSVAAWSAASTRPPAVGPIALIAGPDLPHAEPEVAALAARYPAATVLTGPAATAAATLAALDGASVAHLAAHGTVTADNPLFSAVRLADGPLMAYDLERIGRPPATVVLSACDSAASSVQGEELLGLAVVLLHVGACSVVGTVAPVPDQAALAVTGGLHQLIAAGVPAHQALARTVAGLRAADAPPLVQATALAFVAVGGTPTGPAAGHRPPNPPGPVAERD
jgi:tetratricopeptide (TPR) repeat protein